jgi:hypothetical protein
MASDELAMRIIRAISHLIHSDSECCGCLYESVGEVLWGIVVETNGNEERKELWRLAWNLQEDMEEALGLNCVDN